MIYWKDADFSNMAEPAKIRRRKEERKKGGIVNTLIGAFDTETSVCSYDGFQYAFMYVWQFAVNDVAVYGRTWDDLREFLLNLKADLHLSSHYKLVVYVHNLKYDFQFFKNELNLEGDFLARDARTIIKNTVNDCFEFRDSGCYTEEPLYVMGQEIGYHKLDGITFDYSKVRHHLTPLTELELEYCEHDVLILTKYFRKEAEKYGSIKNIPITATRRVKRIIMENMRKYEYTQMAMVASKQLKTTGKKQDSELLDLLRKSFFGGYTYSNVYYKNRAIDDVTGIDISSCYPAQCLLHKFPMGKFETLPIPEDINEIRTNPIYTNRALLISFSVDSLKCKYPGVGFLPTSLKNFWSREKPNVRNLKSNKMQVSTCKVEMTLTDVDFTLMQRFYDLKNLKILGIVGANYGILPTYIIETITQLYQKKNELKKRNNELKKKRILTFAEEAEYSLVKSMLNRIYGIFVQDPVRTNYEFDMSKGKVIPNGESIAEKFEGVLYQWGVWITAWARYELLNIFTAIGVENGRYKNNILYSDTDSIYFTGESNGVVERYNTYTRKRIETFCKKCKIDYQMLEGIGELGEEHYNKFKTIGLKQYAYLDAQNRFDYHCSGLARPDYVYDDEGYFIMNRGMDYFDIFKTEDEKLNAFCTTMYIPSENAKNHKNIYVDNPEGKSIMVTDYLGNTTNEYVRSYIIINYEKYDPISQERMLLQVEEDRLKFIMKRFI